MQGQLRDGVKRRRKERLLKAGFKVYGIGRNFEENFQMADGRFVPLVFDMCNTGSFYEQMRLLSKKGALAV